ncbi:peptidoglycan bridge formation glycyltransferase FemA/FemB family protein [Desulfallas sp. Bu1-1]|uniref:lipid II:glycine glycyltransferase FemX n=1 Tax=Desulfallas sp. Bu1-1 TaxID=2787620 RepID=UPI00189DFF0E|nr:peptidoglycan bridge formation glycyltransferase FemA/FemB family protein [Desulfallas sp. Bu1-1]MBF7081447.1 peptidoglycan bridge formation glycyltransferase FemA/FemB family protein [Desulfallas sp. Bu1-1]
MEFILNGDPREYTDFIRNQEKGHFMQTIEWSKVKDDWDNLYFVIKNNGAIKAAGSILIRELPVVGRNFMYCPRGPVFADYNDREVLRFFVENIKQVARQHKALMLKIDPYVKATEKHAVDALLGAGFVQKPQTLNFEGIQPRFVAHLDITGDLDEIMMGFHQKTRYNIRLAQRKGVTVRVGERSDLQRFHEIMEETGLRDNFVVRSLAYFEKMYDHLVPPGYMRLYVAEHEGDILSGAINMMFGKKCWYVYGASSNTRRNVMPNYLLQWEMIKWAKESGCTLYDFRGISGDLDPSNPLYGLYRFKKGFNGVFTELIGEFDLVFDPLMYKLWDIGLPLAKNIRSKIIMAGKKLRK